MLADTRLDPGTDGWEAKPLHLSQRTFLSHFRFLPRTLTWHQVTPSHSQLTWSENKKGSSIGRLEIFWWLEDDWTKPEDIKTKSNNSRVRRSVSGSQTKKNLSSGQTLKSMKIKTDLVFERRARKKGHRISQCLQLNAYYCE